MRVKNYLPTPICLSGTLWCMGFGFEVLGVGFRVQGSGFMAQGLGFRVRGSGFLIQWVGFKVWGSGFDVYTRRLGFGVWGFRAQG